MILSRRQTRAETNEPTELLRSAWFKDLNSSRMLPSEWWRRPGVDIRTAVCLMRVEGKRRSSPVGVFTPSNEGRGTCTLPHDDLWQAIPFYARRARHACAS